MNTHASMIVLLGMSALATAHHCQAQNLNWQPIPHEEVEFGVTAVRDSIRTQSPSALESGYDGAYWWGNPVYDLPYTGIAQTFIVPSERLLQSIELRVGLFNNSQPSGQFEVAIYRFDSLRGAPSERLAAVLADATEYSADLADVPVSSFDFSGFGLTLSPTDTYALAVTPTATFTGGLLTLQAATNIYSGGSAFVLSAVPEPNTSTLFIGGVVALMLSMVRKRRTADSGVELEASNATSA